MKTVPDKRKGREGTALFTAMATVLIVTAMVAALAAVAAQRLHIARRLANRTRAIAYAEAGASEAYTILVDDWDACEDPSAFPHTIYGEGSYDAAVTTVSNDMAVITCVGTCDGVVASVALDVKNFGGAGGGGGGGGGGGPAYDYAILADDAITWGGSGTLDMGDGKMHSNQRVKRTGSANLRGDMTSCVQIWITGSGKVYGDAAAPSGKGKVPRNITGSWEQRAVDTIPIPDINLDPYYLEALQNGQVHSGNVHISGSGGVVVPGGIMWVEGDLKISTSGNMVGSFFATGDIKISGSGDQLKAGQYPAFVSRDGDIKLSGSGKVHGLIYTKSGDIEKTGSGDMEGSIISAGAFKKTGSWESMVYENSAPIPPGGGGGGGPGGGDNTVGVSAWQK